MKFAKDIVIAFLDSLCATPDIASLYRNGTDGEWTPVATTALVQAGQECFPKAEFAAKGHKDTSGVSEYFAIDVLGYGLGEWGRPLFAAEHENRSVQDRVHLQYAAWKLYSVDVQRRVLVSFYSPGTKVESFERMCELVREVASFQRGKDLILIGADYNATPATPDDVRALFDSQIIGVFQSE